MRVLRGTTIIVLSIGALAGGIIAKQKPARQTKVFEVLPRAQAPREIEGLTKHLESAMVFVDPDTGELRSPAPGEHQTLTGAREGGSPVVIALPQGGAAVLLDASSIEFLTATRSTDGSILLSHSNGTKAGGGTNVR